MTIWEFRQLAESSVSIMAIAAMAVAALFGWILIDAAKWVNGGK